MANSDVIPLKKILLALAFFSVGITGAAEPALPLKIPNVREACTASTENTNFCLRASLEMRCYTYGNFSVFHSAEIRDCVDGISKMMPIMNVVQVRVDAEDLNPNEATEKSGLQLKQILFDRDLRAIFAQPKTAGFFEGARDDLRDSIRFNHAHGLWKSIYAKSGNDRQTTLKFISEAIQDVSDSGLHLYYLDHLYTKEKVSASDVRRVNYEAAGEFINLYQSNLGRLENYSAYPPIDGATEKRIDRKLHRFLHHFYLPAYLASEMKRTGSTNAQAFFSAFLLNTSYEFVKIDAGFGTHRWPFHDPKAFDPAADTERLKKLYTGYVGALWGIGRADRAKSLTEFSADLAKDPYGAMKRYSRQTF